jgi:hypothetical protein
VAVNRVLLAAFALVILATLGGLLLKNSLSSKSAQGDATYQVRSEWTEVDIQNGVKVLASYIPEESTQAKAVFIIDVSSDTFDLSGYNLVQHAILANDQIEPLGAGSGVVLEQGAKRVKAKITYPGDGESHFHLLIKDLAGISDRVLHFYLNQ